MSEAPSSDAMKRLVKFFVCLAILGIIVALVVYLAVVLPGQQGIAAHAPMNICGPVWGCGPE